MTILANLSAAQKTEFLAALDAMPISQSLDIARARGGINLNPALVQRLTTAVAQCEIGTAPSRYLVILVGDSTMAGTRGTGDVKTTSWPSRLVPLLQNNNGMFDENSFWGNNGVSAGVNTATYDPRVTVGAGITSAGGEPSIGGASFVMSAATAPLVFTPTKPFNSVEVMLVAGSGGPHTVDVSIDGGTATSITGPVSNFQRITITTTLGMHTVSITKTGGGPTVQAISCRDTTVPKLMIANTGRAGWDTTDPVRINSVGPNRNPLNAVYLMQPLAVFINLGINDWSNGVPVATYKANIQTAIDKWKVDSDIVLMVPFPSNTTSFPNQAPYVAALYELAVSNNLPLIDTSIPLGPQSGALYVDDRHPTPTGYQMVAQFLNRTVRRLIARS